MSAPDGGSAFPNMGKHANNNPEGGLSVRDYFAIHCDQPGCAEITEAAGLVFRDNRVWTSETAGMGFNDWYNALPSARKLQLYAQVRYAMADALLAERNKAAP